MLTAGIDGGSRALKVVLYDPSGGRLLASDVRDQAVDHNGLVEAALEDTLSRAGHPRDHLARAVATGYARHTIEATDTTITEITCHAAGVRHLLPEARSIVEIGGQDSKVIRLASDGTVQDFGMNDRCAAGTGRFLEVVASRLEVGLSDLGALAGGSTAPAPISSMCVVFAESEIIGLLAARTPPSDIVAGVQQSIARRVAALAGRRLTPPVAFTGGVALVPGMAEALGSALGQDVTVCPSPQFTGALGAAILAGR